MRLGKTGPSMDFGKTFWHFSQFCVGEGGVLNGRDMEDGGMAGRINGACGVTEKTMSELHR